MNGVYIHLIVNHIPVLGTIFGMLLLAYALLAGKQEVTKAALGVFVFAGLGAVAAYLSGEEAEEVVEEAVPHALIEAHEEVALIAAIGAVVVGVLALVALVWTRRKDVMPWMGWSLFAASLVVSGLMVWTAGLGGPINHAELRSTSTNTSIQAETPDASYEKEDN